MAIRGGYAPPGVYTETIFDVQAQPNQVVTGKVPLLIGTGRETIISKGNTLVRGSSATIDQRIVEEDATGRAVLSQNPDGSYVLGDFDSEVTSLLVRNLPIVTGDGSATVANNPTSVSVLINGSATVVLAVDGAAGVVTIAEAPSAEDDVRVSYYFDRKDTLVTDEDMSSQVSASQTELLGSASSFAFTAATNTFVVTCDGISSVLSLPLADGTDRTGSLERVVGVINAAEIGSLSATTYTDNNGSLNLKLLADGFIRIGAGTANAGMGVYPNQTGSARTATFYTQFTPVVDGSNSGVTTTDVADVVVKVNGTIVQPSSLDGQTGAITLSVPPSVDAEVLVTYYHNTFRDQFDFIPGRDVTSVDRVSLVASGGGASAQFIEGVDWVLQDDKIIWGTASLVSTGSIQNGTTPFGATQVSVALKDERAFMLECSPVVNTSVLPPRVKANTFQLPYQPTDGTGSGIPTSRTDLVVVKTGTSFSDAMEKDSVVVVRVDPATSQIVLADTIPSNHKVFATFYYNNIQDQVASVGGGYTLRVESVGTSNIGTYSVTKEGVSVFGATFEGKGVDLDAVTLNFPSGSEILSDARIESGVAVSETVTVQLEDFDPTSAIFTFSGLGPYFPVNGYSDVLNLDVDGTSISVSLGDSTDTGIRSPLTHFVGGLLPYTEVSNKTDLGTGISSSLNLVIDNVPMTATLSGDNLDVDDWVTAINTVASVNSPSYVGMARLATLDIAADSYQFFDFHYTGNVNGATGNITVTIPAAGYANASLLASAVDTAVSDAIATLVVGQPDFTGLSMSVTSDASGRLIFTLDGLPNGVGTTDTYGYIEFVAANDQTFCSIGGLDSDTATGGTQTKWGVLPVAASSKKTLTSGEQQDRLILKNRTLCGNYYYPQTTLGIEINGGTDTSIGGMPSTLSIINPKSVVSLPSVLLSVGWTVQTDSLPSAIFYDGTDANNPVNDQLVLTINGTSVVTNFTSSASGETLTLQAIKGEIGASLTAAGVSAEVVLEGAGLRVISTYENTSSSIVVGAGTANSVFGLSEGAISSTGVATASGVSSALMSHNNAGVDISTLLFSENPESDAGVGYFTESAIAYTFTDSVGKNSVVLESNGLGNASYIVISGGNAVSTKGNGFKLVANSGAVGEAAYQGFFVTSDNPKGSGSANTSSLNDGVGQDGRVGQTYVDSVTGLTFTLLAREGGLMYPTGADATLTFKVGKTIKTNANVPVNMIYGVSLVVANTVNTEIGDTAVVETFYKGGKEPNIGEPYYIDFTRQRTRFGTLVFTNMADVINTFGDINPQNTLSLGAYLAFLNGARAVALHQVPLQTGFNTLTEQQVLTAIEAVEGDISDGLSPNVVVPLFPATSSILSAISNHVDLQSSLRYRSERRAILGCRAGTQPREAQTLAQSTGNARVTLVYPDIGRVSFVDSLGVTQSFLVDGSYFAVALAAATTSNSVDAATPWTNRAVRGFTALGRLLDAVDANQTANAGVTVLKSELGVISVRHGLTTNMTSVLTKTPTVIQIADEVHIRARDTLNQYIGVKFLPNVVSQIEGKVHFLFKQLVREQLIATYTGISVTQDPNDPTALLVEAFYKPVFPLLYIQFTFNVRSSL